MLENLQIPARGRGAERVRCRAVSQGYWAKGSFSHDYFTTTLSGFLVPVIVSILQDVIHSDSEEHKEGTLVECAGSEP